MNWGFSEWLRMGVGALAGVLVTIGLVRCPEPPTGPAATIVVPMDDVGAWITTNNSFDSTFKSGDKWSGVLFQLGAFYGPKYQFGTIELFKDGTSVAVLDPGISKFYWVNVIAEGSSKQDPIDPGNAFYLFPSMAVSDSCPLTTDRCDRNRKIHGQQDTVRGLITYWHGQSGYEVDAAPTTVPDYLANGYVFSLMDAVRVDVRHYDAAGELAWTVDQQFAAGEIDSIVVRETTKPPDFGAKQEPGWPFP